MDKKTLKASSDFLFTKLLIEGTIFETLEMNFETSMFINKKYYKIIKTRLRKSKNILISITVIECKFVEDRKELIAVDELRNKETKIVTIYKLKETNEKPKYIKYKFAEWYDICRFDCVNCKYKILESDEKII